MESRSIPRGGGGALAALILLLGSCSLLDESSRVSLRIAIDFDAGTGLRQEDYRTVVERVDLSVTSDGEVASQSQPLGEGEFSTTFDVTASAGPATFAVEVVSNNGRLLYTGSTTATIEEDGFTVTVIPAAVDAVLLLAPFTGTFSLTSESDSRQFVARMVVHNRGSAALTWRADSLVTLPARVTTDCELPNTDGLRCTVDQTTAPGGSQEIDLFVDVPFGIPLPSSVTLRILSNVGNLAVPAALPAS